MVDRVDFLCILFKKAQLCVCVCGRQECISSGSFCTLETRNVIIQLCPRAICLNSHYASMCTCLCPSDLYIFVSVNACVNS